MRRVFPLLLVLFVRLGTQSAASQAAQLQLYEADDLDAGHGVKEKTFTNVELAQLGTTVSVKVECIADLDGASEYVDVGIGSSPGSWNPLDRFFQTGGHRSCSAPRTIDQATRSIPAEDWNSFVNGGTAGTVYVRVEYSLDVAPYCQACAADSLCYCVTSPTCGYPMSSVTITYAAAARPTIGSLSDSPDPVAQGSNLTLTANNVTDADGYVTAVEFYRDTNGNGSIEPGTDVPLGTDSSSVGGWTWTGSTASFPVGTNRYLARAQDDMNQWSNTASTTGVVEAAQACCHPDFACTDALPSTCVASGGHPAGVGTACSSSNSDGDSWIDVCDNCDTTGWTEHDNVLFSFGQPGVILPSAYNYGILEWYVAFPDLPTWQQWAGQTPAPPGVCLETGRSLLQITGPVSGDVLALSDPLSALAGPVNTPVGEVFTTAGTLSGLFKTPLPAGQLSVATLTLEVSATPGTYTLGVTEAIGFTAEGEEVELMTGTPFVITVQGQ